MSNFNCNRCNRFIVSTKIYMSDRQKVIITVPTRRYENDHIYCLVVGQSIPQDASIGADVYIRVDNEIFRLMKNSSPAKAGEIRSRKKYFLKVESGENNATFRVLAGDHCKR